jgi:hypothetical protein
MQVFDTKPARLTLADGTHLAYHRTPGAAPGVVFLGGFTSDMTGIKADHAGALVPGTRPTPSSASTTPVTAPPAEGLRTAPSAAGRKRPSPCWTG